MTRGSNTDQLPAAINIQINVTRGFKYMLLILYFIMNVSGMIGLNTAEYKFILIVVFLNFNLLYYSL